MRSIRRAAARSALAVAAISTVLTAGTSTAGAAEYGTEAWYSTCHWGRACLFTHSNGVYNADRCGDNHYVNFFFYKAVAHGNPFTVYYEDGRWDYVNANSIRTVDEYNKVVKVVVHC